MKPERIQRVAEDTRSFAAKVLDWIEAVAGALRQLFGFQTNDDN